MRRFCDDCRRPCAVLDVYQKRYILRAVSKHTGTTLDSMFEETGELDEVNLRAQKRGVVDAVRARMERLSVSKAALARKMQTSRSQVERLLDPNDISLTLATLAKASAALGMKVEVSVVVVSTKGRPRAARGRASKAA